MYLKTLPSWVFCYFVLFYLNWSYFKFLKLVTIESPQACLRFSFILSLIHTHIKLSHTHTHSPFVHTEELLGTSKVKGRSVYTSTDVTNSFINTNIDTLTHIFHSTFTTEAFLTFWSRIHRCRWATMRRRSRGAERGRDARACSFVCASGKLLMEVCGYEDVSWKTG